MLPRINDPAMLPAEPYITTVTLAELTVGPLVATTDEERAARQAHVQQAEADFEPLPFDAPAARAFGRVAASLPRTREPGSRVSLSTGRCLMRPIPAYLSRGSSGAKKSPGHSGGGAGPRRRHDGDIGDVAFVALYRNGAWGQVQIVGFGS